MAVELTIEDGDPWWLSTNLWTVPNEPEGSPTPPKVGEPAYLWSRVRNRGSSKAEDATVAFYWSNPAVGVTRVTANRIGESSVSLAPGEVSDVLCLNPWTPSFINEGHLCIVGEIFHPEDPIPHTQEFNVATDRHVAQRNLSIVNIPEDRDIVHFHLPFEIHNPTQIEQNFSINSIPVSFDEIAEFRQLLPDGYQIPEEGSIEDTGFIEKTCPRREDYESANPTIENIEVKAGSRLGRTLIGRLEGDAAMVHLQQTAHSGTEAGSIVGGQSVLVLRGDFL